MDFLILIPSHMDIHRNEKSYLKPSNPKLDIYLGNSEWRSRYERIRGPGIQFGNFITDEFGQSMKQIGYLYEGIQDTELIKNPRMNRSLYRFAFFSRNELGMNFWRTTKQNTDPQIPMFS